MAETRFLSEAGVTVTQARFMVPSQTYAMSGVTSVKQLSESPSRSGPLILGLVGVVGVFAAVSEGGHTEGGWWGLVAAIAAMVIAKAWWSSQKSTHIVVLHSASGESRAYVSSDAALVSRIVHALNNAIVHRG